MYKTEPRPYQRETVEAVLNKRMKYWALNADPGLGKTKMSIDIASGLFLSGDISWVLVVAPNSVHEQWAEELGIHCAVDYVSFVYHAAKFKNKGKQDELLNFIRSDKLKFFCVNVDAFSSGSGTDRIRKLWQRLGKDVFVVCDESHTIKNPTAERSKALHKIGNTAKYRSTLTGTPITNSAFDLWSQYEYLNSGFFACNYFLFKHRFGLLVKRRTNAKVFHTLATDKDFTFVRNLLDKGYSIEDTSLTTGLSEASVRFIQEKPLHNSPYKELDVLKNLIAPCTFTLTREEHLKELPDKIFSPIYTTLTAEQSRVYKDLKYRYMSELEGQELTLDTKLTLTLRLMQITGGFFPYDDGETPMPFKKNPKLDRLLEDLEETNGKSIIVWAVFRAEIEGICEAVKNSFPSWVVKDYYGGTAQGDRKNTIEAFKAGQVNVLVANLASAGTGLNLQASNLHYFYSNDFSLAKRLQGEDRSYRIGQKNNVVYKDIYIKGTVDELISKSFIKRKEVLDYFRGTNNMKEEIEDIIF